MRRRHLALLAVPVLLAGCGATSTGSANPPNHPLTPRCHKLQDALTAIENNAGKMPMSVWNGKIGDLSGEWENLRQQLVSDGAPPNLKVSGAYVDLGNEWGKC